MTKPRTLVVGLDAACWSYLEPLLDEGRLPVLAGLIRNGCRGVLNSTLPPWTPTAWASIITGKNPGRHGMFDMLWRRPGTYALVPTDARVRLGSPFWKYLNGHGLRVGLVNIPYTQPPDAVDGFVVAGFGASRSSSDLTYPADELSWIEERFGPYRPTVETAVLRSGTPEEILAAEREHQTRMVNIALEAAKRHKVDVLAINLMLLDHANHKMPDLAMVREAIVYCDADLGRMLETFRPDNVVVFSDHGSRRLRGKFLLHAWLQDKGYQIQSRRRPADRRRALNWLLFANQVAGNGDSGISSRAMRTVIRNAVPRLPARLTAPFWQMLERAVPFAHDYVWSADEVDYRNSRVFPGSIYSGLLYLNLIGREPMGVLPASERTDFIAQLRSELSEIEDPEGGASLFQGIYPAEQIYAGPAVSSAPDVILDSYLGPWNIQTGRFTPARGTSRNRYFIGNQREHGWHSRDGVYVLSGSGLRSGASTPDAEVFDIPAQVLYLNGVAIPDDWDGKVMTPAFVPSFMTSQPVRFQTGDPEYVSGEAGFHSSAETEEIVSHLKALGYIE